MIWSVNTRRGASAELGSVPEEIEELRLALDVPRQRRAHALSLDVIDEAIRRQQCGPPAVGMRQRSRDTAWGWLPDPDTWFTTIGLLQEFP